MVVSNRKNKFSDLALSITISTIILVFTLAVFSEVLKADFVMWDDDIIIYNNPNLGALSLERIHWAFTDVDSMMRYNPLSLISWSVTYSLFGLNPFGFHLGNWLLHGLSSVILFFVIKKILSHSALNITNSPIENSWRINSAAFIATLLWALHPLRVEPVAWATDRTYCQALFFIILSTLCYIIANENIINRRKYYYAIVISFACYILSLLSYAIGVTFFAIFFVLDIFLFKRIGGAIGWWQSGAAKQVLLEKIIFALPAIIVGIITLVVRIKSAGVWAPPDPLSQFGLLSRFMQASYILAYYAYRPFYPFDLAPVYSTLVSFNPLSFPFLLRAFCVFTVSSIVIIFRRKSPIAVAILISYVVLLIPVMGFFEHPHYPVDRYSLLPSISLSVLIALLLIKIKSNAAYSKIVLVAILLIACLGFLSFNQSKIWHDSESLFTHMIKTLKDDPYQIDVHLRLGKYLYKKGEKEKAAQSFENILRIYPDDPIARQYLLKIQQEIYFDSKHGG